jgi:hypothetical protein
MRGISISAVTLIIRAIFFQSNRGGQPFQGGTSSGRQFSTAGRIFMAAGNAFDCQPAL